MEHVAWPSALSQDISKELRARLILESFLLREFELIFKKIKQKATAKNLCRRAALNKHIFSKSTQNSLELFMLWRVPSCSSWIAHTILQRNIPSEKH